MKQKLEVLKFCNKNNIRIDDKSLLETAELVYQWASSNSPKNETPLVEGILLKDEYGGAPIPKHNLTRVLDVLDPNWRKPKKPVIEETVFPGNKDEIADVLKQTDGIDISERDLDRVFPNRQKNSETATFVTDELPTSNKKLDDYELEELLDILNTDEF